MMVSSNEAAAVLSPRAVSDLADDGGKLALLPALLTEGFDHARMFGRISNQLDVAAVVNVQC
jgi:hypothetical protein